MSKSQEISAWERRISSVREVLISITFILCLASSLLYSTKSSATPLSLALFSLAEAEIANLSYSLIEALSLSSTLRGIIVSSDGFLPYAVPSEKIT